MNSLLHDNVAGMRQIKAYAMEQEEHERFNLASDALRQATLHVMRVWAIYRPSMNFLNNAGFVLVLWFGGNALFRKADRARRADHGAPAAPELLRADRASCTRSTSSSSPAAARASASSRSSMRRRRRTMTPGARWSASRATSSTTTSTSPTAACPRCTTSAWRRSPARPSRWSVPPARARARSSTCSRASTNTTRGRSCSTACRCTS